METPFPFIRNELAPANEGHHIAMTFQRPAQPRSTGWVLN